MAAVEFVEDRATKREFPAERKIGIRIHEETQKRGLFSRVRGDVFMLAPAMVITEQQIDRTVEVLAESMRAVLG